jgi:hypothetical protein
VVAVAIAVVAVLAVVDRGADRETEAASSSTAGPRTTTDTEPRRGTGAPLLGRPTGIRLGVQGPRGLQVFDLDTGEFVAEFAGRAPFPGAVVPRRAGAVLLVQDMATYFPDLEAGPAGRGSVSLGLAQNLVASDHPDRVWLIEGDPFGRTPLTLTEVDLTGRVLAGPIELPSDARPVAAVDGGLIVNSVDGIFHIGRDGASRRVAPGVAFGAHGTAVVHRACDEQLRCAVHVTDVVTGGTRVVPGTEDTVGNTFNTALRPDGAVLAAFGTSGRRDLVVIDLADGTVLHRSENALRDGSGLTWSPDGRWLFWPEFAGAGALSSDDGRLLQVDVPPGFALVAFGGGG